MLPINVNCQPMNFNFLEGLMINKYIMYNNTILIKWQLVRGNNSSVKMCDFI